MVAAGEAQIESTVTGNDLSGEVLGLSKDDALRDQHQVYLPINNALSNVSHHHTTENIFIMSIFYSVPLQSTFVFSLIVFNIFRSGTYMMIDCFSTAEALQSQYVLR